jgi:iron(III) transport system permease protein
MLAAMSARGWRLQSVVTLLVVLAVGLLVLYPVCFLVAESVNVGDPENFPSGEFGFDNFGAMIEDWHVLVDTAEIALAATVMAIVFGFTLAWILSRCDVPWRPQLERLMELPYYMTPLVGALAWGIIAGPKSGFVNQLWRFLGGSGDIVNAYSIFGIAWVMALFEGTVAFVMISAAMKSMDPALEESSRVLGASKLRTMLGITLPLVAPRSSSSPRCWARSPRRWCSASPAAST